MSEKLENYLYNGVSLPPLPEWNKSINPYAAIVVNDGEYRLYCRAEKIVSSTTSVSISTYGAMFVIVDGQWSEANVGATASTLIWANHDVRTSGGALVLAKSIPIYSISKLLILIGWGNDPDDFTVTDIAFNDDDTVDIKTSLGKTFRLTFNRDDSGEVVSVTDVFGNVFAMPAATDGISFVEDGDTVTVTDENGVIKFAFSRDEAGEIASVSYGEETTTLDGIGGPDTTAVEYSKWFLLGKLLRRNLMAAKGEPVAYLYGGVRLPKLPEWDKVAYPYAYIVDWHLISESIPEGAITLYLCSSPWYADTSTAFCKTLLYGTVISYAINGDSWEYNTTTTYESGKDVANRKTVVWCSVDILKLADGSVFLAATKPIPVYE